MAGRLLGRILFAVAYILLAGHDFVPHRHIQAARHEHHEHDHDHDGNQHDKQAIDFDVIGLFAHSHGAGQTSNIYFNQGQDQHLNVDSFSAAAVISTDYQFGALSLISQSNWPEYTCAKAPPNQFSFRQLRAPPISSFTC
ncbi:hypothetical protein [Dyadobacter linearis]|uniref:hypothetical protein n=1 Tax=Dyadobacter linearis TaxID=2823330 RepID=UPI001BFC3421|nr:hypothetical protein [Dyadobacter sp. CECT 9623]